MIVAPLARGGRKVHDAEGVVRGLDGRGRWVSGIGNSWRTLMGTSGFLQQKSAWKKFGNLKKILKCERRVEATTSGDVRKNHEQSFRTKKCGDN
jgi:hypothetical protein